uniref:trypsin n=1 Tax=Lygus hesperus TaxID=30085 RepID=A0A0A9X8P5_LYGHE
MNQDSISFGYAVFLLLVVDFHFVDARTDVLSDDKIVGGRIASNIPFLVSIQKRDSHNCGGSLISMTIIQTACHCVGDYKPSPKNPDIELPDLDDPSEYEIVAGDFDLRVRSHRTQKRTVHEMLPHPACVKILGTLQWDFAIMTVKKAFVLTKFVKTTKLFTMNKKTFEEKIASYQGNKKKSCWVMGWGKAVLTAQGAATSRYLKAVQMRIITDDECRYYLSQQNPFYVNYSFGERAQMCAVGLKWAESDCQGDSGGPVYCKGHLLGTVSYGFDCGRGDQPAVYTKLSEFLSWYKSFKHTGEARDSVMSLQPWSCRFIISIVLSVRAVQHYFMYSRRAKYCRFKIT